MQNRSIMADGRSFQAYSFLSTLATRPQEIRYVTIHRRCRLISFFPQRRAARGNDTTHLFYKVPLELFSPLFSYILQKTLKFTGLVAKCLGCDWGSGFRGKVCILSRSTKALIWLQLLFLGTEVIISRLYVNCIWYRLKKKKNTTGSRWINLEVLLGDIF